MKVFPVDLAAKPRPGYSDAFNAKHLGTDIFADRGTSVFAVDDGTVRKAEDPKGGIVAYLAAEDGFKYYYAHLTEFIGGTPRKVNAGELIGTVGTTGNAQGKAPHVHFQVSEPGTGTVDPFPYLKAAEILPDAPMSTKPAPIGTTTGKTGNLLFWSLTLATIAWIAKGTLNVRRA